MSQKNIKSVIHGYSRKKEEEQTQLVAKENNLPYINLVNYPFTGDVLEIIPNAIAKKNMVIAFNRLGNTVRVATPYPHNVGLSEVMNEIGHRKNILFEPHVCSLSSINFALTQYDKLVRRTSDTSAKAKQKSIDEFLKEIATLTDFASALGGVSITQLFESILSGALAFDATDVHFEPQSEHVRIRFRVDGELLDAASIDHGEYHLLLSRVKNLAHLKLNRQMGPQDGRFSIAVGKGQIDVRVNVLPATYGETIELRLLTAQELLSLERLGLAEGTKQAIERNIKRENGLIVITGPTGSGKTTTLYAVLSLLNKPDVKIITIEDPVEYKIAGIEQIEVDHAAGFDFSQALRAVLRQDPDVILVGEIRDKETAEIAINASLTGHLVLTTLHTNSAPATFARLIEMGVPTYLLADAISLIIAQRLVRRVCASCNGKGCPKCGNTGKKGRVVISEFLEPSIEFAELIKNKATLGEFAKVYKELGYKLLNDDLQEKIAKGLVSPTEKLG
ncbi:MAG: type II/IV secretion system protein [Candidatus Berkelbacteria bacterium]|nr:MAG: type II/IV secretion system protein [Candidatus Berkelbacteria bacterium]QQG51707.1 MAG: type II/IV secretion system protein [Candidatus Berkelbacteria bacterium]